MEQEVLSTRVERREDETHFVEFVSPVDLRSRLTLRSHRLAAFRESDNLRNYAEQF